jgi:ApbE superfamily uncharacterized protein (UPF0280 family)
MRVPPKIRTLPDGKRLHLSDGPIDLIVEAFGHPDQIHAAYNAAAARFVTILDELCSELPLLRQPMRADSTPPTGVVARRMANAVAPFAPRCFITPMAAVAGSVAEEILITMTSDASLTRAYVNNGGDIAFHLDPGQQFVVGMIERPDRPSLCGTATLHHDQPVRGIATSGWRGRSFSLGIADAVTVLASNASRADAAATVIANAVDLPGHPGVVREPACHLAPDTDLGSLPVTRSVPELTEDEIQEALASGARVAEDLLACGLICSAALCLQNHVQVVPAAQDTTPHPDSWSLVHA